jgi:hypothetical protein
MKKVSIVVPCLNMDCDGEITFSESIEQMRVGYQAFMHTKSGYCSKCNKKLRIEVDPDSTSPFGFQIFALKPLWSRTE